MISHFKNIIKYYFDFGWIEPSDIFFFKLILTHDYIMCFLIFVLAIVTWLLRIIVYNFYWGEILGYKGLGWRLKYKICIFIMTYLICIREWLLSFVITYGYGFIYFVNYHIYHWFMGGVDSKILGNSKYLADFFFRRNLKKKSVRFVFFLAGPFCIMKGYYLQDKKPFNFFFFNKVGLDDLLDILEEAKHDRFLYAKTIGLAFIYTDGFEKFYKLQQWRHSFNLEFFWAVVPSFIIALILGPSLVLLYSSAALKHCDYYIAVNANQWYWNYLTATFGQSTMYNICVPVEIINEKQFPKIIKNISWFYMSPLFKVLNIEIRPYDYGYDYGYEICHAYDSYMLELEKSVNKGLVKRLLDTTQHIKSPALNSVKFSVTSNDVLHSFSLNSIGIKIDAVTGRVNDMTVFLPKEGIIGGQCSELCGSGHYGMPVVLESLWPFRYEIAAEADFWIDSKDEFTNCPLYSEKEFEIAFDIEERVKLDPYLKEIKVFVHK